MFVLSSHEIWLEQVTAVAVVLKLALHHHHDNDDKDRNDDKIKDDGEDHTWIIPDLVQLHWKIRSLKVQRDKLKI